jgi:hypothetical protein
MNKVCGIFSQVLKLFSRGISKSQFHFRNWCAATPLGVVLCASLFTRCSSIVLAACQSTGRRARGSQGGQLRVLGGSTAQ